MIGTADLHNFKAKKSAQTKEIIPDILAHMASPLTRYQ